MQRYEVTSRHHNPPQYLGGVDRYDVFYWASDYNGEERLIVKWGDVAYWFYYWDFAHECWRDQYSKERANVDPSPEQTETILAMYECFAIKPCNTE